MSSMVIEKLPKNKMVIAALGTFVVVIVVALVISNRSFKWTMFLSRKINSTCIEKNEPARAYGSFMHPILQGGQDYIFQKGFYQCNAVEQGDVVQLKVSDKLPVVPRLVQAVGGDYAVVKRAGQGTTGSRWNLWVNGELVTYGADHPIPFYFGDSKETPELKKQLDAVKGVIPPGKVILTTTMPPGNMDSTALGLLSVEQLLGRVLVMDPK